MIGLLGDDLGSGRMSLFECDVYRLNRMLPFIKKLRYLFDVKKSIWRKSDMRIGLRST